MRPLFTFLGVSNSMHNTVLTPINMADMIIPGLFLMPHMAIKNAMDNKAMRFTTVFMVCPPTAVNALLCILLHPHLTENIYHISAGEQDSVSFAEIDQAMSSAARL